MPEVTDEMLDAALTAAYSLDPRVPIREAYRMIYLVMRALEPEAPDIMLDAAVRIVFATQEDRDYAAYQVLKGGTAVDYVGRRGKFIADSAAEVCVP